MKLSLLSKAIGAGVISFNLAMLPLALPVAAQTSTTPSSSNTGSSTNGDATTGTSNNASPNTVTNTAPGASSSDTNTTSSDSSMSNSTAPSGSTTGSSPTSGSSASGTNSTSSQGATATTSSENAPARSQESPNWAWFGLLGLIGVAGLLRRPRRTATVGLPRHEQLRANVDAAGVQLNQGLSHAGTEAHNLIEDLQTRVSTFQERRAQEKEIKRIKNALGRPSKRVILDRQDNVILNIGDLITNEAVERARAADMLDVLLNSVDESDPEIKNEERVAPVPGEASLEEHNR